MVFGLFDKGKALQRTIDRATNKLAQQADRWGALERLKEDGTEEALVGLCKRWAITSTVGVQDEQEKAWVVDVMVEKGPVALAPLRKFMRSAGQLSYPLKALAQIAKKEKALEIVDELLADEPPGYTRDPERKLDIIRWLSELHGATADDVAPRLAPYVGDFDENVRWSAVDGLAHFQLTDAQSAKLVEALIRPEEESGRVKRRIAEVLAEKQIPLGAHADKVPGVLVGPVAGFSVKNGVLVAK
ncbi:MAG TPA: hypothetical protein VL463_04890 [Kofleriaceae bacterium]|jgi:hypothetical protein|nr:hypothetical protein [Kofleriaceae bacterium]